MEFLSVAEVAKLFGINETTVRRNARTNSFPFSSIRVGGLWKFPKDEIYNYIKSQTK